MVGFPRPYPGSPTILIRRLRLRQERNDFEPNGFDPIMTRNILITIWQVLFFKFDLFSTYFRITTLIYSVAITPLRYSCEWVSGSAASNKGYNNIIIKRSLKGFLFSLKAFLRDSYPFLRRF